MLLLDILDLVQGLNCDAQKQDLETDYALLPGVIDLIGKLGANRYSANVDAFVKRSLI